MGKQVLVTFVGFFGVTHAGVLTHGPEATAVHGGLNAACEGILSRVADIAFQVLTLEVGGRVERLDRNVGGSLRVFIFAVGGRAGSVFRFVSHPRALRAAGAR